MSDDRRSSTGPTVRTFAAGILPLAFAVVGPIAGPAAAQEAAPALSSFAQPAINPAGDEIAFVHGGDIWAVDGSGGTARLLVSHAADESRPLYSPDGTRLAFMSDRGGSDNLYVLELRTGVVTRLTWSEVPDLLDAWSADGEWLYFTSTAQDVAGMSDVFRVSVRGGTPMPVAADRYAAEYFAAPSPDGLTLAVSGRARMALGQWWRNGHSHIDEAEIWLVDISQRNRPTYSRLTQPGGKNLWAQWTPDGRSLVFMSDRAGAENLWQIDVTAARQTADEAANGTVRHNDGARSLTRFTDGRVLWPALAAGGSAVVFERDFGIWRMDLPDGEPRRLEIDLRGATQDAVTEHVRLTNGFTDLALSPDGTKLAFTARGEVFATSAKDGGPAARVSRTVAVESEPAWAPDSRRLVYASRRSGTSKLWLYDFVTETETEFAAGPGADVTPVFSPDGRAIAFVRDGRELRVREIDSGRERVVATGQLWRDPFTMARPLSWSPDGRWLAYFDTDGRMFTNVHVVPADASAPARRVSRLANSFANSLAWSADGKSLFFDTQHRTEDGQIARVDLVAQTPAFVESRFRQLFDTTSASTGGPGAGGGRGRDTSSADDSVRVEIEWDGIFERLTLLPLGLDAGPLALAPDGKTVVFVASAGGQQNLYSYSLDPLAEEPRVAKQLTSTPGGKGLPTFSSDGREVYFLDRGRLGAVNVADSRTRTIDTAAELDVDFHDDKLEVFAQGWDALHRHFYDPDMHGTDWSAVRETFAPRIAGARTRGELSRLMNLMVGELNASHLGYGAPPAGQSANVGRLGLRFDAAAYEATGQLLVTEVVPLSPADVAGIRPGETLLAIDGEAVGSGVNLDRLLENRRDRRVELQVAASAARSSARVVAARPISVGAERQLAYRAWVASRRAYVDSISNGRFGYVHMPDMGFASLQRLMVDLDAENFERAGVVIDIRNNNGGFVNAYALDVFARRGYMTMEVRGYPAVPARTMLGQRSLEAPTALVINRNSLSDAEDFTEGYRTLGLGPVIGEPTAGWIIYTWGIRLVDGGSLRMPRSLIRGADGENMELSPRPVDMHVDAPLGEWYEGRDRQLEAAVEALRQR